eukprot:583555-Amphidinium_carterae.1
MKYAPRAPFLPFVCASMSQTTVCVQSMQDNLQHIHRGTRSGGVNHWQPPSLGPLLCPNPESLYTRVDNDGAYMEDFGCS